MTRAEMIEKLRGLQKAKVTGFFPEWLPPMNWGGALSDFCGEVADELEHTAPLTTDQVAAALHKTGWRHHSELAELGDELGDSDAGC